MHRARREIGFDLQGLPIFGQRFVGPAGIGEQIGEGRNRRVAGKLPQRFAQFSQASLVRPSRRALARTIRLDAMGFSQAVRYSSMRGLPSFDSCTCPRQRWAGSLSFVDADGVAEKRFAHRANNAIGFP